MAITKQTKIARLARPTTSENCYSGIVAVAAGETFKIETSPGGEDILTLTVPAGKVYQISVRVEYTVEDA